MLFKEYLTNERELAESTVEAYNRDALDFIPDLESNNYDVRKAMYQFTIRKMEQKIAPGTFNNYLSALNNYIRYLILYKPELPIKNTDFKMKYRKFDYLPKIQTPQVIRKIQLILDVHTAFSDQEKCIISLAINHGLMPIDYQSIRYQDICFEKNEIIIHRDGNSTPRFVFLTQQDLHFLSSFIASKSVGQDDSPYVFSNGKRIFGNSTLIYPLNKLSDVLGEQINFRKLRNTFIVDCLGCEINPMYVMVYMGIKHISTVYNFDRLNINRFKEVATILEQMRQKPTRENRIRIIMYYRKSIAVLSKNIGK